MDEIQALLQQLRHDRPVPWEEFPDLSLYMDQVLSYMPRQLSSFRMGRHSPPPW